MRKTEGYCFSQILIIYVTPRCLINLIDRHNSCLRNLNENLNSKAKFVISVFVTSVARLERDSTSNYL